ncbi:MoaD/ThiS family protein [Candidatus Woesearchaeota archaeon]|nr:MoaD/ThiS family protein [Candidatus Woesearchaeota archaeon]
MNITLKQERTNTTHTISFPRKTVKDLLQQLNINSETVIIIRNNTVITEDELLKNDDEIELLSVVSGG